VKKYCFKTEVEEPIVWKKKDHDNHEPEPRYRAEKEGWNDYRQFIALQYLPNMVEESGGHTPIHINWSGEDVL